MIRFLIVLSIIFSFFSCSSDVNYTAMDIIVFNNDEFQSGKYSELLKQLASPFESNCNNDIVGFDPLVVSRKDLNVKSKLDYFDNPAGNRNKVKFAERELKEYFLDTDVVSDLKKKTMPNYSFDPFLKTLVGKKGVFVYSKEEASVDSLTIYSDINAVHTAIDEYICSEGENLSPKITLVLYRKNEVEIPVVKPTNNNDLASNINLIANRKEHSSVRLDMIDSIFVSFFTEDSKVLEISDSGVPLNGTQNGFPHVKDWLRSLATSRTIEAVTVTEFKKNATDGLISEIHISETHLGDAKIVNKSKPN